MKDHSLIYSPIGGAGEIGMNMYAYGFKTKDKISYILVDAGVSFPKMDSEPGVDLIFPNPKLILNNLRNLEGIFITHAHEDHLGAIGFIASKIDCKIFCRKFTAAIVKDLKKRFSVGVITNDIYTKEDAEALMRMQILPEERLIGVETGGCPHTAIREDASINLAAVEELQRRHDDLDLIFIESGGDNLSATFSPELADITVYMIDVAMGSDIPRKRGPAMMKSDILLVNKTDLAPYVDVDLSSMESDLKVAREDRPYFLIQAKNNLNIEKVSQAITDLAGL